MVIEIGYLALELRELLTCPSLHCRLLHTVLPGSKRHSEGAAGEVESPEDATREYGVRRTSTTRDEIRNHKIEIGPYLPAHLPYHLLNTCHAHMNILLCPDNTCPTGSIIERLASEEGVLGWPSP